MDDATATDVGRMPGVSIETQRRTGYRWLVLVMLALISLITLMDRTNISIAAPMMMKEFGFTKTQMGFVFGAFAWAYSLGQFPAGWLSGKFGPRKLLAFVALFWSLMTIATAHAWGLVSLVVIRFVFGLGESGCMPSGHQAMQYWYLKSERGLANGVFHGAGQFATSVVPLVAVAMMTAWGWRSIFYGFGLVGVVWSVAWWFMYRDHPEQSKHVNAAEAEYIRAGIGVVEAQKKVEIPWGLILGCPTTWLMGVVYAAFVYSQNFFLYWMPTYLMEFRHFSLKHMGNLAPLPLFAGCVGVMVGGILSDYLAKKTGNLKWSRRGVCIAGLLGAAISIIPAALASSHVVVVICLIIANFFTQMVNAPSCAVSLDIAGGYAGIVYSVMNMIAQTAGAASMIIFGALAQRGYWIAPFYIIAAILTGAALLWAFAINPERSVLERA
jgi:sugar phosphate permease